MQPNNTAATLPPCISSMLDTSNIQFSSVSQENDTIYGVRESLWYRGDNAVTRAAANIFGQEHLFIETNDINRVNQFRKYGLIRGNTPASLCYAMMGDYLRRCLEDGAVDNFSSVTQEKIKLVIAAQARLETLYADERAIHPENWTAQENLRRAVLKELDSTMAQADQLGYSFFRSGGRLRRILLNTKAAVENYRFPIEKFDEAAQGDFSATMRTAMGEDQNARFIYHSEDYQLPSFSIKHAIQTLYANRECYPLVPGEDCIPRSPVIEPWLYIKRRWNQLFGKIDPTGDTEPLRKMMSNYTSNTITRFIQSGTSLFSNIPKLLADIALDVFYCVKNEYENFRVGLDHSRAHTHSDLLNTANGSSLPSETNTNHSDAITENIISSDDDKKVQEENTPVDQPQKIHPLQARTLRVLTHSNALARIARSTDNLIDTSNRFALNNPIATAVIVISAGSASFTMPITAEVMTILSELHLNFMSIYSHTAPAENIGGIVGAINKLVTERDFRHYAGIISESMFRSVIVQSASVPDALKLLDEKVNSALQVNCILANCIVSLIPILSDVTGAPISIAVLNQTKAEVTFITAVAQTTNPNNTLIGALVSLPLRIALTPIRLITSLIFYPFNQKSIVHEFKNLKNIAFNIIHITGDFMIGIGRSLVRLVFFGPKFLFKLATSVTTLLLGTLGDITKFIGEIFSAPYNASDNIILKIMTAPLKGVGLLLTNTGDGIIWTAKQGLALKDVIESTCSQYIEVPILSASHAAWGSLDATFNQEHPAYLHRKLAAALAAENDAVQATVQMLETDIDTRLNPRTEIIQRLSTALSASTLDEDIEEDDISLDNAAIPGFTSENLRTTQAPKATRPSTKSTPLRPSSRLSQGDNSTDA